MPGNGHPYPIYASIHGCIVLIVYFLDVIEMYFVAHLVPINH